MSPIFIKSLLTSLSQREDYTPLWQRGARGDFSDIINPAIIVVILNGVKDLVTA